MTTPPPNPTPNPNPESIAGGNLLGTNAFQHGVDEFRTVVTTLEQTLQRMASSVNSSRSAGMPTVGSGGAGMGSGGSGLGAAPFGANPGVASQLTAWQRLQAQVAQTANLQQRAPNYAQQFGSGLSSTLFGRAAQNTTMGGRAANIGGQLLRAGIGAAGSALGTAFNNMSSYAGALDSYSRQMMLGNATNGRSGGALAQMYGQQLQRYGGQYWSNSPGDMFSAGITMNQQAYQQNQGRLLTASSATAMLNPGMGTAAAVTMEGKFQTMGAYYNAQMMGLSLPRSAGGGQNPGIETIKSIANRVNANIGGFQNLGQRGFQAEIAQGGTLSTSISAFGNAIGLSPTEQNAYINQLKALNQLQSHGMSAAKAQSMLNNLAAHPSQAAFASAQKAGLDIGSTLSATQNLMQGKQANGNLMASADYLDAARATAQTLTDIYGFMQKIWGPASGMMGAYDQGGIVGVGDYMFDPTTGIKASQAGQPIAPAGSLRAKQQNTLQHNQNTYAAQQKALSDSYKQRAKQVQSRVSGIGRGGQSSNTAGGGQGSGSSGAGGGSSASGNWGAALAFAKSKIGDPYVYGADGPNAWDCSSFVQAAWKAGGVSLPRTSQAQSGSGTPGVVLPLEAAAPGDLIFYGSPGNASHVGLVTGPDTVLEAPHTGDHVKYEKISQDPGWKFAKRVAGGAGAVSATLGGGTPGAASSTQAGIGSSGSGAAGSGFGVVLGGSEISALAAVLTGAVGGSAGGNWGSSGADTGPSQTSGAGNAATSSGAGGTLPSNVNTSGYTAAEKSAVKLGQQMAAAMGWTGGQFTDLFRLWNQESSWNANAVNSASGAYGIPQALGHGHPFNLGDTKAQISWGLKYIKGRYGNPSSAWAHEEAKNWYSGGISEVVGDQMAKLHDGEMVLTANQAAAARRSAVAGINTGNSGSATINFQPGAITIQMASATSSGAQGAAKSFVDFVAADPRIKSLMGGY